MSTNTLYNLDYMIQQICMVYFITSIYLPLVLITYCFIEIIATTGKLLFQQAMCGSLDRCQRFVEFFFNVTTKKILCGNIVNIVILF